MLKKLLCGLLLGSVAFIIIGSIGSSDHADQITEEHYYCQQVHDHVWPDYRKSYRRDCKDGKYVAR